MVRRVALERRALELRHRKFDAAGDRGAVRERARRLDQLIAEPAGGRGTVDHGPVDDDLLRADAGPFDEIERDLAVHAGADGVEHLRVRDRRGVAFALQHELLVVDAARDVGRQHQQEIDLLRACRRRRDLGQCEREEGKQPFEGMRSSSSSGLRMNAAAAANAAEAANVPATGQA